MTELKPCPFCGDDMQFADWTRNAKDSLEVLIAPMCIGRGCGATGSMWATREEAIAAWNTRPDPIADPDYVIVPREVLAGLAHDLSAADERATRLLSDTNWRPTRAHCEGLRNQIRKAAAMIAAHEQEGVS